MLNFEARGSSGPSLMYETHRGNLATVPWLARCLPRPCFTSSAYVTVYRNLPNDTDFTVFTPGWLDGTEFRLHWQCAQLPHGAGYAGESRSPQRATSWRERAGVGVAGIAGFGARSTCSVRARCGVLRRAGTFVVYFPQSWALPVAVAALPGTRVCVVPVAWGSPCECA